MQLFSDIAALNEIPGPLFLAAGFFDGIHRGHEALIRSTIGAARAACGRACVMTFDRHPLCTIAPQSAPPLLCSREESLSRMEAMGVDAALILRFTDELAATGAGAFAESLLRGLPQLAEFRCGANWKFGAQGLGTPKLLAELASASKVKVRVVPYEIESGSEISSTRIRDAVFAGDIKGANLLLGRAFATEGEIVHGRGAGHSALQVATANIIPDAGLVFPADGVYATLSTLEDGTTYKSVSNLGVHPTFARGPKTLETHLLGFSGYLYGKKLRISFLDRLRDEIKFNSVSALSEQIASDIQARLSMPPLWGMDGEKSSTELK